MSRRPALRALLLAATPCLLGALLPCPAGAWGAAFTDRALEAALAELPFATAGLGAGGGSDGLPAEAMGELEVGAAAEQAVAALARALASGGRADVEPALACVVSLATDLWQPLASAGFLDPPGAAPGFFFRYEVVLAARVAEEPPSRGDGRRARPVADVATLARSIAAARAGEVPALARAEARARAAAGGLQDGTYYAVLAEDLGADLETALAGAADTAADLIETAWERSGRARPSAGRGGSLSLRAASLGAGEVVLEFVLPASLPVRATVYDVAGRRVAGLAGEVLLPPGFQRLTVRLAAPRDLASGIYFLRLSAGELEASAKLPIID